MTLIQTMAPTQGDPKPDKPKSDQPVRGQHGWIAPASLITLLIAIGVLYIWGLSESGYANSFYSAAAQAGSTNWTAWFFGSLDGGNSITVDKPPAAIWLMALSVRLFGLNSWSILVPEALLGVASVGILYAALRRSLLAWRKSPDLTHPPTELTAHWAALIGALAFALTPAATLMFRFNNPDALLVFTLVLASYFTVRASETASRGWLALAGVAIGLGFLTKMMQAFLILPALALAYWIAAPGSRKKRLVDLLVAAASTVASFGWYLIAVELTPASLRPYIGGSQSNSLLELILSYNGLGRLTGNEVGSVGGGGGWGSTGILRMFEGVSGGMVSWLIPAALVLSAGALWLSTTGSRRLPAPGEERTGRQRPHQALAGGVVLWLGWLVVTSLVFSYMAGIYHDYYTIALAPAIGGSLALGGAALWANRGRPAARRVLAVTSIGTGVWALVLLQQAGSWYSVLGWTGLGVAAVAGVALWWSNHLPDVLVSLALAAAIAAGLAGPYAYSINTAATAHTGSIVTAGPVSSFGGGPGGQPGGRAGTPRGRLDGATGPGPANPGGGGGMGGLLNGASTSAELTELLRADATSYTWAAATIGSQNAASYQLATGEAVMAIGGFNGSDPSPTLQQFRRLVAEGKVHYFIANSIGAGDGGSEVASQITTWVKENYDATTVGETTVYDLTNTK